MKRSKSRKITFLNTFGSVGYVTCLLQWLWTLIILLPSMLDSPFFRFLSPNISDVAPVQPIVPTGATPEAVPSIVSVLAIAIGICIIVGAVYVLIIKFPRSVAKSGEKVTHAIEAVVTPIVIEHVVLPREQRRQVPDVIIASFKLLVVFAPLFLLLFARDLSLAMSFEIVMIIGIWLFSWSFLFFALQFALSKLMNVPYRTLR